jgi:hypothetical protein
MANETNIPNTNDLTLPAKSSSLAPNLDYAYNDTRAADVGASTLIKGVPSLHNNYAVFSYASAGGNHNKLKDILDQDGITPEESKQPSTSKIIKWSQENSGINNTFGATPYSWSDFLYTKHLGLIPNNHLLTLRRFPVPTFDNLKTSDGKPMPPMAQAVTWFGSDDVGNKLSDLMKFSAGIKWKQMDAGVQDVDGNEQSFNDNPFSGAGHNSSNATVKGVNIGQAGRDANSTLNAGANALAFITNPNDYSGLALAQQNYAKKAYGSEGPYANKFYGPVNAITSTMGRDRGLSFEQDFSIVFHYELKSIGSINPKAAMLDVIANLLALTYNNAKFWGGAIRYFPQHPRVPFFADQQAFYNGDANGFVSSLGTTFKGAGNLLGNMLKNLLNNPLDTIKKLATGGGQMYLSNKAAASRPEMVMMRSLLTGAPIGEWHLCVGNPMNPIAMIGNLICTGIDMEFGDMLGADDFPTELKATIKLKHGRPRDKGDIESMFNQGNGRLYYGALYNPETTDANYSSANNSATSGKNPPGNGNNTPEQINKNIGNTPSMWGSKFNPQDSYLATATKFFD